MQQKKGKRWLKSKWKKREWAVLTWWGRWRCCWCEATRSSACYATPFGYNPKNNGKTADGGHLSVVWRNRKAFPYGMVGHTGSHWVELSGMCAGVSVPAWKGESSVGGLGCGHVLPAKTQRVETANTTRWIEQVDTLPFLKGQQILHHAQKCVRQPSVSALLLDFWRLHNFKKLLTFY